MRLIKVIPYEPNNLGKAYNDTMRMLGEDDWCVFIDHDVLTLNPHWYEMCVHAIKVVGPKAGFISCKCNRIGGRHQWVDLGYGPAKEGKDPSDVEWHRAVAKMVFKKYGFAVTKMSPRQEFSGFFILTSKKAWKAAGGFTETPGELSRIDTNYNRAIRKAGYELYLIEGLYYFHVYRNKDRSWK